MSGGMQQAATVDAANNFDAGTNVANGFWAPSRKTAGLGLVVGVVSLFGAFGVVLVVLTHFLGQ